MSHDDNKKNQQENQSTAFDDLLDDIQLDEHNKPEEAKAQEVPVFSEDSADASLEALLAEDDISTGAKTSEASLEDVTFSDTPDLESENALDEAEDEDEYASVVVRSADNDVVPLEKSEPFIFGNEVQASVPTLEIDDSDEDEEDIPMFDDPSEASVENNPKKEAEPVLNDDPLSLDIADDDDDAFQGIELDLAEDDDLLELSGDDEDLPDLDLETTAFNMDDHERKMEEKFFKDTLQLATSDLYTNVLNVLQDSDDIGVDATAKARIAEYHKAKKLPQLICKELIDKKVITPIQLARSVARTLKRKEITTFLNIPQEAMGLRTNLDSRVCALLREARVIPLWHRVASDNATGKDALSEIHLAHESATRNLVLEAAISEFLPEHKFVWHFALRDVCGMFWLSGEEGDVDASMEAEALLDRIVGNAVDARSSDIHVDPSIKGEYKAIVRYRIDGFVQSKEVITLDQLERLRVRIENVARMPKVDQSHPNKGAFTRAGYDWRVQIQPHAGRQGPLPRIVIRRLNPDVMGMEELGYPEYFIQYVKEAAKSPNGLIFWTGPTGSGKTESIHSAIVSVNPMGRGLSVHTIEDPPEKRVPGYAVQMEIMEADPARTALELLKSSLRADPDVIVFGEVRDSSLAKLVFEAANTGHLVFTTLHTNTSLDAIVRLSELGINGFNLSYVRGIAAQKLVRRLCTHCKQPVLKPNEYTRYVFDKYGVELQGAKLFTHDPSGCPSCNHTGYHGRIAIAEWLKPNKEIVEVSESENFNDVEDAARRAGWKPMGYMATLHVKEGITDIHEIAAKVQELAGDLED